MIMPDPGFDARIQFLDSSARLFQSITPATSAYLMHERNTMAGEHGKALNKAQLKDICRACGTILTPDVTSKVDIIDTTAVRRKKRKLVVPNPEPLEKQIRIECLFCRRVVITPSQQQQQQGLGESARLPRPVKQSNDATPESQLASEVAKMETEQPISANASSKKRAKARKQVGLQALLEKSKEMDSKTLGTGLDLMDLMKKT